MSAASAQCAPIPPFESEAELWEGTYYCLLELRQLRGLGQRRPDQEAAKNLVTAFCSKLRQCPRWLSLPRIQHEQRLTDNAVVVVATALAINANMPVTVPTLQFVGVMAYGFEPPALERFKAEVQKQRSVGRFLHTEQRHQFAIVHPSDFLLGLIGNDQLPADAVAKIRTLPTAPAGRDGTFKRRPKFPQ